MCGELSSGNRRGGVNIAGGHDRRCRPRLRLPQVPGSTYGERNPQRYPLLSSRDRARAAGRRNLH